MYSDLIEQNASVMEAYTTIRKLGASHLFPSHVKLQSVNRTYGVTSHQFVPSQENIENIHDHLVKHGFQRADGPQVDTTMESRYTNPETKQIAYLGKNKSQGWLDIHQS